MLIRYKMKLVNLNIKNKVMSIAEMKLAAINEIANLNDEKALKEVLEHLVKISNNENKKFDADIFFQKASEKYDDVLQKLSQ